MAGNTQIEKDAAFVWHQDGDAPTQNDHLARPNSGDQLITARPSWTKIDDCSVTFTCPDCLLWIHGTVQLNQAAATTITGTPSVTGEAWNDDYFQLIQFAIMIDGYVIPETIVGGTELDNDEVCGLKKPMFPAGTSLVLPVAAGQHIVTLVTRSVGPTFNKSTTPAHSQESPLGFYASCRELIVLEMRR